MTATNTPHIWRFIVQVFHQERFDEETDIAEKPFYQWPDPIGQQLKGVRGSTKRYIKTSYAIRSAQLNTIIEHRPRMVIAHYEHVGDNAFILLGDSACGMRPVKLPDRLIVTPEQIIDMRD